MTLSSAILSCWPRTAFFVISGANGRIKTCMHVRGHARRGVARSWETTSPQTPQIQTWCARCLDLDSYQATRRGLHQHLPTSTL
jgi:hypothetical protein